MRRTVLLLAGVLLSTVALGSDSPKEYDDRVLVDELEGTWQFTWVDGFLTGIYRPLHYSEMTYRGGTFSLTVREEHGRYRLDPTHNPPHIDWTSANGRGQGQTLRYIYRIDGDTLRIAGYPDDPAKPRPHGFDDPNLTVWTYKRVKK